jgi:hypothetical protein
MNAVYSTQMMKRRYEVWFVRCGLANGSGAWWFRYLLMNLGRKGRSGERPYSPVQVWATWFPRDAKPKTFIRGYPVEPLDLSARNKLPFYFRIAECGIEEDACWGDLNLDGHAISWKLRNQSNFGVVLSDKGWIGFSKSPHSNAQFSGEIVFDGRRFSGDPLGFGVQGHNCGYRHRTYWRWMHAYFPPAQERGASTLEALVYDMPFGMVFRKAVWWHNSQAVILKNFQELETSRDVDRLEWKFSGNDGAGLRVDATVEASPPEIHVLPYLKTDCSGTLPVSNASLANAVVRFGKNGTEVLETIGGAVLEMGGA